MMPSAERTYRDVAPPGAIAWRFRSQTHGERCRVVHTRGRWVSGILPLAIGVCAPPTVDDGAPAPPRVTVSELTATSVTLTGSGFTDSDSGAHAATEWQVDEQGGDWSTP